MNAYDTLARVGVGGRVAVAGAPGVSAARTSAWRRIRRRASCRHLGTSSSTGSTTGSPPLRRRGADAALVRLPAADRRAPARRSRSARGALRGRRLRHRSSARRSRRTAGPRRGSSRRTSSEMQRFCADAGFALEIDSGQADARGAAAASLERCAEESRPDHALRAHVARTRDRARCEPNAATEHRRPVVG